LLQRAYGAAVERESNSEAVRRSARQANLTADSDTLQEEDQVEALLSHLSRAQLEQLQGATSKEALDVLVEGITEEQQFKMNSSLSTMQPGQKRRNREQNAAKAIAQARYRAFESVLTAEQDAPWKQQAKKSDASWADWGERHLDDLQSAAMKTEAWVAVLQVEVDLALLLAQEETEEFHREQITAVLNTQQRKQVLCMLEDHQQFGEDAVMRRVESWFVDALNDEQKKVLRRAVRMNAPCIRDRHLSKLVERKKDEAQYEALHMAMSPRQLETFTALEKAVKIASISQEEEVATAGKRNFVEQTTHNFAPPQRAIYDRLLGDRLAAVTAATANMPAFWTAANKG